MRQYQPEPRTYELMTILSPEVADDDLQGQIDAISGYVTGAGGEVMDVNRESPWGRRRLAYAIRHSGRDVRDGYYALFHLRIEPRRVIEVERDIKLNDQILRYLVTHYEPQPIGESATADGDQPTAPAEAAPQPEAPAAAAPAVPAEPAPAAEPALAPAEPVAEAEAATEATTEPEAAVEPEAAAEPETVVEPEVAAEADAPAEPDAPIEPEVAAEPETPAPTTDTLSGVSETTDDQPQVATAAGTEEQAAAAPATTPGEEPENPPAQPDATPKEE